LISYNVALLKSKNVSLFGRDSYGNAVIEFIKLSLTWYDSV